MNKNTSIITEDMIRNAIDIRCHGGYHAHADFHIWMHQGLLRIYSKQWRGEGEDAFYGYEVALDGRRLDVLCRGIRGKDQSALLHAIAYHEYGRRRGL